MLHYICGAICAYMYDLRNHNQPIHLSSVHIKYENKYKLRNKTFYKIPFSKSTQLINSILITEPKLWNNLPNNIKNIKYKNQYKKKLKIYSFNQ